jgi:hypothetical protein
MTMLMTMDRLKTLLDAYGASPARWPAEERAAAEAMIAASDEARAAFAEAARLDSLLDRAAPPPPADRLGWRLRGIGPKAEPTVSSLQPRRGWMGSLARAAAVALAVAGGVAIGFSLPHDDAAVTVAANDFGDAQAYAIAYDDIEFLQEGSAGIVLAGYSDDALSLPLQ